MKYDIGNLVKVGSKVGTIISIERIGENHLFYIVEISKDYRILESEYGLIRINLINIFLKQIKNEI